MHRGSVGLDLERAAAVAPARLPGRVGNDLAGKRYDAAAVLFMLPGWLLGIRLLGIWLPGRWLLGIRLLGKQ